MGEKRDDGAAAIRRRNRGRVVAPSILACAVVAALAPALAGLAIVLGGPQGLVGPGLALAGAAVAGAALWAAWRRLRALTRLARAVAPFANPRRAPALAGDDIALLGAGVAGLLERLEDTRRRADPARLEDPLTGLPNRLAATRRARDEIARARRAARPLAAALLEISAAEADGAERQRILRAASETLAQAFRAYDQVGRWSEAVFVIVMPEAEIEHAVDAVRRARDRILADAAVAQSVAPVSVRAGVAVLQPDDATLLAIAARAEGALARARDRGEGRVETAPGPRTRPGRLASI